MATKLQYCIFSQTRGLKALLVLPRCAKQTGSNYFYISWITESWYLLSSSPPPNIFFHHFSVHEHRYTLQLTPAFAPRENIQSLVQDFVFCDLKPNQNTKTGTTQKKSITILTSLLCNSSFKEKQQIPSMWLFSLLWSHQGWPAFSTSVTSTISDLEFQLLITHYPSLLFLSQHTHPFPFKRGRSPHIIHKVNADFLYQLWYTAGRTMMSSILKTKPCNIQWITITKDEIWVTLNCK